MEARGGTEGKRNVTGEERRKEKQTERRWEKGKESEEVKRKEEMVPLVEK